MSFAEAALHEDWIFPLSVCDRDSLRRWIFFGESSFIRFAEKYAVNSADIIEDDDDNFR